MNRLERVVLSFRNRPAFKQKKPESGKKRQTINRALGKSGDGVKKYRSDESKQKKREADRKRQAINRALGKSRKRQNTQDSCSNQKIKIIQIGPR
ncbi:hypothetical protein TNCV_3698501 [Trichonephila clavipes]|uniref:Uncharacterized protein n=1 Tax=Trichonephila clavipes TaxID=2585209 RepID=A0A8X6SN05_TRICX|nr:hypothetical protein TNCV_3698501 [Trichonephila clavipes]